MEKSGITRRIDSLGRIVIPKEIRKHLRINDSDEMNISINNDEIVLTKNAGIEKSKVISIFLDSLSHYLKKNILLTSKDCIIDKYLFDKKSYLDISLSEKLLEIIRKRKEIHYNLDKVNLFNREEYLAYAVYPLIPNGDLVGSIIVFSNNEVSNDNLYIMDFSKRFLENYLE